MNQAAAGCSSVSVPLSAAGCSSVTSKGPPGTVSVQSPLPALHELRSAGAAALEQESEHVFRSVDEQDSVAYRRDSREGGKETI